MREVHTDASLKCNQCTFKCKTNYQLKRHLKVIHSKKEFLCNICSKLYGTDLRLKRHMKLVHSDEIYQCDQCDYTTSDGGNGIRNHVVAKHIIGESFICSVCDFETSV